MMSQELARSPGRPATAILREPFARRTWSELGYALVGLPLGVVGFAVTVAMFSTGFGNAFLLVGLPLIAVGSIVARWFAAVDRTVARRLLGMKVAEPAPLQVRPGVLGWFRSQLTDVVAWRARAYLLLRFPVSVATFVVAVTFWAAGIAYTLAPLTWLLGLGHVTAREDGGVVRPFVVNYGSYYFDSWPKTWLLCVQGVILLLLAPWAVRGVLMLDRWLIGGLLGPTASGRVRDLEQTRAHAVDDSAARLRTIERDLHDGAQAQLVAVAMKLGLAKEKLGGEGAAAEPDVKRALELVDTAHRTAREAINELRDLARGIHPPVLDRGLGPALATLAARSAVPVELVVDVPERPSPAIETIAYFCAAELLANVAKHSGARRATVEAVHVPELLRVRVTDDGRGGASMAAGTGLRGLAERVRTVDGRLDIDSPPGGPTVVTVELPSHA
ncbi:MAG: sensor domain-containing protein [Kitasatospora sp.]|nr:sensor domain-containing protein [Kitasatospora sp.]